MEREELIKHIDTKMPDLKESRKHLELAFLFYRLMIEHFDKGRECLQKYNLDLQEKNLEDVKTTLDIIHDRARTIQRAEIAFVPCGRKYITKSTETTIKKFIQKAIE